MNYEDIFDRPIEEYTVAEIRERAIQLREVAKTSKIIKATSSKTIAKKAAVKKSKQQEELDKLMELALMKGKENEDTKPTK